MSVAKYKIELDWKEFNVDLESVEVWMKANAGSDYCGNQAHARLELWFLEEPSQEVKDAIAAYWDGISEESDEAEGYVSAEDRAEDREAKKASGKAKLIALGLTEAEAAALVG